MSLNIRTDRIFPGMGQTLRADSVFLQSGISLSGNSQTSTPIPSSGSLAVPTTAGRLRIKIYNGGGTSPTLTDLVVTCGDGTFNIVLGAFILHPTVAIPLNVSGWFEFEAEYIIDAGSGTVASGQLSGTVGGANVFAVKTTLGGTSPTASMDLELCPLI